MLLITPYLLTYLCFFSFSYLIGMYSFIHQHLCDLYQISKTHLGFCNGLMAIVSTIGVILYLVKTIEIKRHIVTFFTWGSLGLAFAYCLIVLSSVVFQGKAPKIMFYISVALIGICRSMFIQCLLIMLKIHKEIYDKTNHISENNYKLLTNLWPASFGMVVAFFVCNWLQYTVKIRWQLLVIVGVSMKLLTTTLLFFGLQSYLENDQTDSLSLIESQTVQKKPEGTIVTISSFLTLLNQHFPSKLFLINSTILDDLHIAFCYTLPAFFYASGYKGNQGYLTAMYSLSMIVGTFAIAFSDYFVHIYSSKSGSQSLKDKKPKRNAAFMFIFSVSLFFFLIALIVLSFMSFQNQNIQKNQNYQDSDQHITIQMILVCALGFFFGGPLKSYFSYKTIKAMGNIEKQSIRRIQNDPHFRNQQEKALSKAKLANSSFKDRILGHQLEVSSSLITANRFTTFFLSFVVFLISFYLVDKYLPYTMVFFTIVGLFALIFDVIQNFEPMKEENS